MKNVRGVVMLVVALVAGLVAVVLAAKWIQDQSLKGNSKIAVANAEIPLGGRISPEMVRLVDWPAGSVPTGAFSDAAALDGRVAKTPLTRGEPILEAKLAPVGTRGGLSAVVAEGKRAITVRVNDVIGVAGFALPGTYVDIMVNTQEEGGRTGDKDRTISKIVLEHILVLAVAQEANRDETKPKVVNAVTLEVTPEEAEKLDLARSVGTLSLVLRNQVDPNPSKTAGATKEILLALPPPALKPAVEIKPPAPSAPRRATVATPVPPPVTNSGNCIELIRGSRKSVECF
jgi:pilus assembly protein CpaB